LRTAQTGNIFRRFEKNKIQDPGAENISIPCRGISMYFYICRTARKAPPRIIAKSNPFILQGRALLVRFSCR
jgi:hypothetical protein